MANWKRYSQSRTSKKDQIKAAFIALTCIMLLLLATYKVVIYSDVTQGVFDNSVMIWAFSSVLALSLEALRGLVSFIGLRDFMRGRYRLAAFGLFVSLLITGWDIREAVLHNVFGSIENNWIMGLLSVLVIILEIRVGLYFAGQEQGEPEQNDASLKQENETLRNKLKQALENNASLSSKVKVLKDEEVLEAFKQAKAKHDKAEKSSASVEQGPQKRRKKSSGTKDKEVKRLERNKRQWKYRRKQAEQALEIAEANEQYEKAAALRDRIKECQETYEQYDAELKAYKAKLQVPS